MTISDQNLMTSGVEHFREHWSLGLQLNRTVCSEIRVCCGKFGAIPKSCISVGKRFKMDVIIHVCQVIMREHLRKTSKLISKQLVKPSMLTMPRCKKKCFYCHLLLLICQFCLTGESLEKFTYVSLRLRVQNRRKKWNFPLNFRTMHKLSDLYSRIFQTQSSGCVSGVDYFRNFTKLKNLNF